MLIFLAICSQSSLLMVIFVLNVPKPIKGKNVSSPKQKKSQNVLTSVIAVSYCSNFANVLRTVIFKSFLSSCFLLFQQFFPRCSVRDLKLSVILPINLCSLHRWKLFVLNVHRYTYKLPNKVCIRRNLGSPCRHISYISNVITGTVHVSI